jgi:hypothetical protein
MISDRKGHFGPRLLGQSGIPETRSPQICGIFPRVMKTVCCLHQMKICTMTEKKWDAGILEN